MRKKYLKLLDKISDSVTTFCGDIRFVILHVIFWTAWITLNIEPFPYGLLTLIVSLEAIVLSTFILMSQNRSEKQDRKIAANDLRVDKEVLKLVNKILEKLEN